MSLWAQGSTAEMERRLAMHDWLFAASAERPRNRRAEANSALPEGSYDVELEKRDAKIRDLEKALADSRSRHEDLLGQRAERSTWTFGIVDRLIRTTVERGFEEQGLLTSVPSAEREAYLTMLASAMGTRSGEYVPLVEESDVAASAPVKLIAFYLPQFHPIPENDRWWGRGFTEWTNVSRAVPQFVGHYQPHLPGELGFYDLRVPEVQRRQVELAKSTVSMASAFTTTGSRRKRLLERPTHSIHVATRPLTSRSASAGPTRTGRAVGTDVEDDVLIAQHHDDETDAAFIRDIEPMLRHRNYIRIDGRPVLVVYRPLILPEPAVTAQQWREHCLKAGLGNPYLIAAHVFESFDPSAIGFDAAVEFPPSTAGRAILRRLLNRCLS